MEGLSEEERLKIEAVIACAELDAAADGTPPLPVAHLPTVPSTETLRDSSERIVGRLHEEHDQEKPVVFSDYPLSQSPSAVSTKR
ncbi:unnamed protein product [Angiostrongylus costaricensis]|uniref:Uncharacterized protein n=1 Tax=Angiostrongylus costaricensis TaxID=334426 RepID=A0A0R3PV43_ANGCS|nr:unnamed protein product [Angiostrongylus costaricensis]